MDPDVARAIELKAPPDSELVAALARRGAGDEDFALLAANHPDLASSANPIGDLGQGGHEERRSRPEPFIWPGPLEG